MNSPLGALDAPHVSGFTFPVSGENPGPLVLPWIFAAAEVYRVSRKLLGEQAECAFLAEATARGLIVSKPYGDSAPYDFIVEKRRIHRGGRRVRRGRLWKIQVKSASRVTNGVYELTTRHRPGLYLPGEIDFFAGWVAPLDVWYIIPARAAIARATACLSPHLANSHRRYEKYKEAWHLLGG